MKSFIEYIVENRKLGKKVGNELYIHKDYVDQTDIPKDVLTAASSILKQKHPNHEYNIIRHNKKTNDIGFLNSPDWDESHEPYIHDSVKVSSNGETAYTKPKKDPQIYHQKWKFVGDDYKGFDVDRSKNRTKQYMDAIAKRKTETGDSKISNKIGYKSYWDREIVPHIKTD